jgi:hypothetical protein
MRSAGVLVLSASLLLAGGGMGAGTQPEPKLRLLVPAYFYPAGRGLELWDKLLDTPAPSRTVVIVNPASGPGAAADPNYAGILKRAERAKVTPIGYVTTSYGRRPLRDVEADVDRWARLYPGIRGIFFDEQPSGEGRVEYQAALYQYVRERKGLGLVVTNPGTTCSERYLSRRSSDATCLFEGPLKADGLRLPAWTSRYAADRIAALAYEVGTAGRMRAILRSAAGRGVGYVYVTDAGGANPWDRLPDYWDEEVAEVMKAGRGPR